MSTKKTKQGIADAITAGAKLAKEGKPIPYIEGKEELDFDDGIPEKDKISDIEKAFKILLRND